MADRDERHRDPPSAPESIPGLRAGIEEALPGSPEVPDYAMDIADESFNWYKGHAIRSRALYRVSETSLLAISASIPVTAAVMPNDATIPAILGASVAIIAGLRSVFHWQDNYLRFSEAREAVEAERRLYRTGAKPYEDPSTRDQILVSTITRIEHDEMSGWLKVATARPKP